MREEFWWRMLVRYSRLSTSLSLSLSLSLSTTLCSWRVDGPPCWMLAAALAAVLVQQKVMAGDWSSILYRVGVWEKQVIYSQFLCLLHPSLPPPPLLYLQVYQSMSLEMHTSVCVRRAAVVWLLCLLFLSFLSTRRMPTTTSPR